MCVWWGFENKKKGEKAEGPPPLPPPARPILSSRARHLPLFVCVARRFERKKKREFLLTRHVPRVAPVDEPLGKPQRREEVGLALEQVREIFLEATRAPSAAARRVTGASGEDKSFMVEPPATLAERGAVESAGALLAALVGRATAHGAIARRVIAALFILQARKDG